MEKQMQICSWFIITIISIAVGSLVGYLFSINDVPNIVTSSWIAFIVSLAALLVLPAFSYVDRSSCSFCTRKYSTGLVLSAAGTLLLALAALSIDLTPTFFSIVVLVGLGAAFFTFMFITFIAYLLCILNVPNEFNG